MVPPFPGSAGLAGLDRVPPFELKSISAIRLTATREITMTRAELWMDGYLDTEELTNTEIADLIQLYEGRTATNEASMQLLSLLEEAERRTEEAELVAILFT